MNREKAGLSQKDLADKLGVSQPQVSMWENGLGSPSKETILKIATISGTDIENTTLGSGLGDWLRTVREKAGLTQAQLAAKAGISPIAISFIETGKTESPQTGTLRKLEKILGPLPKTVSEEVSEERQVESFEFLGPFPREQWKENLGTDKISAIYVFYDELKRPVRIGQTDDLRRRLTEYERDAWWFRSPTAESFAYVVVNDADFRSKTEKLMIKLVGDNAIFNIQERI